jgi:hypothetical protein
MQREIAEFTFLSRNSLRADYRLGVSQAMLKVLVEQGGRGG